MFLLHYITLGSHVIIIGNIIMIIIEITIIIINGNAPIKISSNDALFPNADFMEKRTNPKGGVSNPISIVMIVRIPNHIRSYPIAVTIGTIKGTVTSKIDVESNTIPRITMINKNIIKITISGTFNEVTKL